METAVELRAEVALMRKLARAITDPVALREIELYIVECEGRARQMCNGDGAG